MSGWTAIVPIKPPAERKSRLAGRLTPEERLRLSEAMLRHVLEVLAASPEVGETVVLSQALPPGWWGGWAADGGGGLNAELQALVARLPGPILVISADLPVLSRADLADLAATPAEEVAIAPDRHMTGTNALALGRASRFGFSFGPGSFKRHRASAGRPHRVVVRPGLALDIDRPGDLHLLPRSFPPWNDGAALAGEGLT